MRFLRLERLVDFVGVENIQPIQKVGHFVPFYVFNTKHQTPNVYITKKAPKISELFL
jgi:hypothetical protein